jgi:hypothetical protein
MAGTSSPDCAGICTENMHDGSGSPLREEIPGRNPSTGGGSPRGEGEPDEAPGGLREEQGLHSVYRLFPVLALSIVSSVLIAPLAPSIIKADFHTSMCPNITAAVRHNASAHVIPGHDNGYALESVQDSGRGLAAVLASLVAGWLVDNLGRCAHPIPVPA